MRQRTGSTGALAARDPGRPTSVVLIEDQQALAGAIQGSLATISDVTCVGAASTLADGVELVAAVHPDVVVTDFRLTDGEVSSVLPELLRRAPDTKVLVFTGWPDERSFLEVMALGAGGFLDKAAPFGELVEAIRRVDRGEVVVSPRLHPPTT